MKRILVVAVLVQVLMSGGRADAADTKWIPMFNGRDLEGWIAKINHHPLGDNYRDTFVVRDGVLRVSYDNYPTFKDEFAHLIYRTPYSKYRLRLDYRFVGEDTQGAPAWASRNSGVMIHGQSPEGIGMDQPFPISVEVQLLNGTATQTRPTGNVCTPGTQVSIDGSPLLKHCQTSSSRTFSGEGWVRLEIEVLGGKSVAHRIDGVTVLTYENPQLDPTDLRTMELYLQSGQDLRLDSGYISLQGEGHPIEFRNIEILPLPTQD